MLSAENKEYLHSLSSRTTLITETGWYVLPNTINNKNHDQCSSLTLCTLQKLGHQIITHTPYTPAHPIAISKLVSPFNHIGWCLEHFGMISLTVYKLTDIQTHKRTGLKTIRPSPRVTSYHIMPLVTTQLVGDSKGIRPITRSVFTCRLPGVICSNYLQKICQLKSAGWLIMLMLTMTRDHSFPRQISPNSAGQFAKFRGSPRQNLLIPQQPIYDVNYKPPTTIIRIL